MTQVNETTRRTTGVGYIIGIIVGLYLKHGEGRGTIGFPQEMGMVQLVGYQKSYLGNYYF
jgi:hypothetical protein